MQNMHGPGRHLRQIHNQPRRGRRQWTAALQTHRLIASSNGAHWPWNLSSSRPSRSSTAISTSPSSAARRPGSMPAAALRPAGTTAVCADARTPAPAGGAAPGPPAEASRRCSRASMSAGTPCGASWLCASALCTACCTAAGSAAETSVIASCCTSFDSESARSCACTHSARCYTSRSVLQGAALAHARAYSAGWFAHGSNEGGSALRIGAHHIAPASTAGTTTPRDPGHFGVLKFHILTGENKNIPTISQRSGTQPQPSTSAHTSPDCML